MGNLCRRAKDEDEENLKSAIRNWDHQRLVHLLENLASKWFPVGEEPGDDGDPSLEHFHPAILKSLRDVIEDQNKEALRIIIDKCPPDWRSLLINTPIGKTKDTVWHVLATEAYDDPTHREELCELALTLMPHKPDFEVKNKKGLTPVNISINFMFDVVLKRMRELESPSSSSSSPPAAAANTTSTDHDDRLSLSSQQQNLTVDSDSITITPEDSNSKRPTPPSKRPTPPRRPTPPDDGANDPRPPPSIPVDNQVPSAPPPEKLSVQVSGGVPSAALSDVSITVPQSPTQFLFPASPSSSTSSSSDKMPVATRAKRRVDGRRVRSKITESISALDSLDSPMQALADPFHVPIQVGTEELHI